MRRYEKYKPSGIEWIGDIPEHWKVNKIKHRAKLQGGFAFKSERFCEEGIPIVRIGDIKATIEYNNCKRIIPDSNGMMEYEINKYDTLIALSGATTGKTCYISCQPPLAYINQRVAKVNFENKFLFYVISGDFVQRNILLTADGSAQENISNSQIENMEFAVPPIKEQEKIAEYLDEKCGGIDALIERKERLLELYAEKRQAIINRTVTRGIDPNAPLKDSGIQYLGQIPKHWEVKKLKYLGQSIIGVTYSPEDVTQDSNGLLVLRSSNIQNGILTFDDCVYINKEINYKLLTKVGDVLVCARNGSANLVGKSALIDEEIQGCTFGAFMTIVRSNMGKLIYYILNSNILKYNMGSFSTSTVNQLTIDTLNNLIICLPPIKQQTAIVSYIEEKCGKIDQICEKLRQQINLYREYRTALIANAVTGKIKIP